MMVDTLQHMFSWPPEAVSWLIRGVWLLNVMAWFFEVTRTDPRGPTPVSLIMLVGWSMATVGDAPEGDS